MRAHPSWILCLLLCVALLAGAVPALAVSVRPVPLATNDVVYNPHDGFLYASVPSQSPTSPNSVVRIDPATGALGPAVTVGSEPHDLALSDDGVTLYVGLDGAGAIRRVDLSNMSAGPLFTLGNDPYLGTLFAEDIEVLPGDPNAVAVSLRNQGFSPRHMGVAIFDNGVARPTRTSQHTGSNVIAFGASAARLYGYNNETTEYGFRRMNVTASGVTVADVTSSLVSGFSTDIEYANGRIYASTGRVIDPEARALLGTFSFPDYSYGGPVAPTTDRVYVASGDYSYGAVRMNIFDPTSFAAIERYSLTGVTGSPATLRAAGGHRLVLRTTSGYYPTIASLYVLDGVDDPPTCDLVLGPMTQSPALATAGSYLYLLAGLANHGQARAEQVSFRARPPAGLGFQYASSSWGGCYDSLGTVVCSFPSLAAGDSITVTMGCVPASVGTYETPATLASATRDANPADNTASWRTDVRPQGWDRTDLYLHFTAPPDSVVVAGQTLHYRLELGNRGPADATLVRFDVSSYGDSLPVLSITAPGLTCVRGNCMLATLPAGTTIPIEVSIGTTVPGFSSIAFNASGMEQDSSYNDNYLYQPVIVLPSAERLLGVLAEQVRAIELHVGPERVLLQPLQDGAALIAAGDTSGCCALLEVFRQRLDQRTGRALTIVQAYDLFLGAVFVENVLDCLHAAPAVRVPGGPRPLGEADGAAGDAGQEAALPAQLDLSVSRTGERPSLRFALPTSARARIDVLDVQGRSLGVLFDGELPAGIHSIPLPGGPERMRPGVYLYRLTALGRQRVAKVASLR